MRAAFILTAAFLIGLGFVIGSRLSTEAMGVVVGVVLGIAAAIPTTLLVALILDNQKQKEPKQPDVFIVDGRGIPQYPTEYYAGGRYRQIPPPRDGRVN